MLAAAANANHTADGSVCDGRLLSPASTPILPIKQSMLDEVQSHPTGLKPHSMQSNSTILYNVGGINVVDSDFDEQTDPRRVQPRAKVTWSNTIRVCLFTTTKYCTTRCVDDSDVDSDQDNLYTPLREFDGFDAPMASESYTSRSTKRSKEKFRWTQVNAGDIRSNALYDKARAIRNARLLERSALHYVCENNASPGFTSYARHWPVIWTDKVALLFSDYTSTTYTNNGNYRFPPRTVPLQKMAQLVNDNPDKYVHLIAAKSKTLD